MPEAESSRSLNNASSCIDPTINLPLTVLRSELIPSAPTRSASAIDWLPDFVGYSWVAYGASSLLVVSHFPSPLSHEEAIIGPIFRQVFELSKNSSPVTSITWSPATPSIGELAAASENRIFVFSHDSATSKGSFCWSQNAILVQGTKVEAIEWTGSGDGIIAGGIQTVLWKKKNTLWEIAWKFKENYPQNLVSATWSIEGLSAAATCTSQPNHLGSKEVGKCVFVYFSDGKPEYTKLELCHPRPVSMVQWRPSAGMHLLGDTKQPWRYVLLTCCLDGTVRLWCEIDNGRARKFSKDTNDYKTVRRSFSVAAVIEINQALNGGLGMDVFITWAREIKGMFKTSEGGNQFINTRLNEHGNEKCEWLVGIGPGNLVSFWTIHCLDDISPLRFPRVTLWKKENLELKHPHTSGSSSFKGKLLLNKVVISRNCASGPPTKCSVFHLSHCNSLVWSLLHTQTSRDLEYSSSEKSETRNLFLGSATRTLHMDGHTGIILQVAVHPWVSEFEMAVSLDSNGLLLFWSLSTISNCISSLPTFIPSWRVCGMLRTQNPCSKYTSLRWAPTLVDEDRVLLVGHAGGIDCFIVKISQTEVFETECHYICTIPFTGHCHDRDHYEDGPANVFSVPLPSCNDKTIMYNKFMLLGVWMTGFESLSWEITFHSFESESCCGCIDNDSTVKCSMCKYETTFCGKKYCIGVNPCSSQFSEPHSCHITSFAVGCPSILMPMQQNLVRDNDLCNKVPPYTMATGFSDGSLRLWRSSLGGRSTSHKPWELVGMFVAHQGPVSAICLTDCGQKIATVSVSSHSNTVSILCIWEVVCVTGLGSFILEDTLPFDSNVVAVNWLTLENGQFTLGVCLQNELKIYAQRHSESQILVNSQNSWKMKNWFCLAFSYTESAIRDFFWCHRATPIVVHESYLSIFSGFLLLIDKERQTKCHSNFFVDNFYFHNGENINTIISDKSTNCDCGSPKFSAGDQGGDTESGHFVNIDFENDHPVASDQRKYGSGVTVASDQLKYGSGVILGSWSMVEIAEKLRGPLPVYHPKALLTNIHSGNWKRAYVSVRHLVESLPSSYAFEKRQNDTKSSHIVPQIPLSTYFGGPSSKGSTDSGLTWSGINTIPASSSQFSPFSFNMDFGASNSMTSPPPKSELIGFIESLQSACELAGVSDIEKIEILASVALLNELDNKHSASAYENLDEPGRRFWVELRFQQLKFFQRFGKWASVKDLSVDSWLIAWAFHSDCQETLFGSILPEEPSWPEMRALGVGFWFTNMAQLRTRMEKLARLQYLKKKDPKDCALLYVALNRIQVLTGLFKISKDEKDKPLVGFLSRNFQEEKNKAAALKNAYVLLGRHQLELAIAFFMLGGDTASAVSVCAKNLGDEQLALVICRLVEKHGGPLEHNLITKFILPSSIERGDYWLTSLLEWELGNYSQSLLTMLGFQSTDAINQFSLSSNNVAFMDPAIGLYCLTLANKNSMRNAIGEKSAATLCRWAALTRATALKRCGLPLDALECLSSSPSTLVGTDQDNVSNAGYSQVLPEILKPSAASNSSNWLLGDAALHLESCAKIDLALQYFSNLMREHPSWPDLGVNRASICFMDFDIHQYEKSVKIFQQKFYTALALFEQRFSVDSSSVIVKILVLLSNNGLFFIGHELLRGYMCQQQSEENNNTVDSISLYLYQHKPLFQAAEDTSIFLSRFIAASSISCSHLKSHHLKNDDYHDVRSMRLTAWRYCFQCVKFSLWGCRAALRIFSGSFTEELKSPLSLLDLYDYYVHFASAWLQRDSKGLLLMLQPLLITHTNGNTPYEVDMKNLETIFHQVSELVTRGTSIDSAAGDFKVSKCVDDGRSRDLMISIPEDERWQIMGACLWQYVYRFMKHSLNSISTELDENHTSGILGGSLSSWRSSLRNPESGSIGFKEQARLLALILSQLLKSTVLHMSSYHVKQLASFLLQKVESGFENPTARWLDQSTPSQSGTLNQHLSQGVVSVDIVNKKDEVAISELLWNVCADPNMICEGFAKEGLNWQSYINCKPSKVWNHVNEGVKMKHEMEKACKNDNGLAITSSSGERGSPGKSNFQNIHTSSMSWPKDSNMANEVTLFEAPKEICKRNGELFEALCINSIDQRQGAIASNRKGIVFFNQEDNIPFHDHSEYIWSMADWPLNGWAGSESTPIPTFVSPGVGLGSNKGAHLGLGGATIGVGSVARSGRDLTGGVAFGIPGYAGIGASGLGWGIQDDFEEFVDPPATVENISTRAFSSHPSRPFFLVGSSNTHIYLWEFGRDKATATYGVLPAANVPPPYALASIFALQFDHCGHRFASAALDGTVCTWQLEVGGRSNVRPMESCLCFNSHAMDVTYITSSGSVIAAAGHSSNGANIVVWDTLAPPTSSRASITCHEGGARSISVFDNDLGSGSVSPLIITGGKAGDVGIHDFRYIATGRTKRHKHSGSGEPGINTSSNIDTQTGFGNKSRDQNGMLWYIPKAHQGSVTRISTIPNTSLFLTGSKDGDVKLWDAKASQLICHWSKLHEKHTFLQPSSRGFGGVVRAAVTDIQVISNGFLSCGGDGSVKLVELKG